MSDPPGPVALPLGPAVAARLSDILAQACDGAAPGWSADELTVLAAQPGVTIYASADGVLIARQVLDEAEILSIAVRPAARRRGLARHLLSRAIGALRHGGVERLFLEVAESNRAARALYASAGFEVSSRRKAYYPSAGTSREDAVLMDLTLDPPRAPQR